MAVSSLRTSYNAAPRPMMTQEQIDADALNRARLATPQGYGPLDPIVQGWTSAGEGFRAGDINQEALALEQSQPENREGFSRLRDRAAFAQQKAQMYAPRVQDYRDVNSLGDAANYIGGGIGQGAASLLPITAAALPGALVGGPVGAVLSGAGAFAAGYGMNRGENVTNQYADPDVMRQSADERAGAASMTAAGQSLLDTIVPGRIAHGLRGVAKSGLGRRAANVLTDMGTEGVTEGAQDVMGQYSLAAQGSQKPFDQEQAVNSAILGAVGAGPISGAGNVAGSVADRAVDAGLAGVGLARDAAGKVKQTVQEKVVPAVQGATAKAKKSDVWKDVAASAQAAYDGAKTVGAAAMESPIFGEALQAGQAALKSAADYVAPAKITETADRAADFLKNTDMADIKSYASDVFADRFSALVGNAGVDETQDPAVLSGKVPNTPEGLNLRKVKLNDIYTAAAMSVLDGSGGQEYTDADRARAQALTESRTFTPSDELWLANSVGRPLLAKQLTAMKDSAVAYVADRLTSRPTTTKRSNRQGSALEARPLITAVGTLFGRDAAKAPEYAAHLIEVSQDLGSFDPHYVSKLATKLAVSDPKGTIIQALRASGGNELADTMERELSIGAQGEVMRGEAPMLTQSAKDGDKLERAELLGIAGYIDRNAQSFERAPDNTKLRMLTPLIPIYGAENARALLTHYAGVKRSELQAQQDAAQQGAGGVIDTLSAMFDPETAQGLVEDYQQYSGGQPGQLQNAFADRLGNLETADQVVAMFKGLKNDKALQAAADDRGPSATDQRYGNMAPKLSTSQRFAPGEANDSNYEDAPNEIELSEQGINEEDVRNLKPGYRWPKTVTPFYSGNERDMAFMAEDAAAAGPDARVATMEEYASAANLDPGFLYKRVRADVRRRLREAKKTDRAAIEAQIEYLRDIQDMGVDLDPDQEQDLYDLEDALDDPNLSNDAGPGIAMLTEQLQLLNSKKEKALASFNVVMRPEEETRASDDQLEKYAELLNKATAKTRDAIDATKITFRTARGTDKSNKLVLSAESMMYASPGKGSIADRLFEAIKSVLARPDIISMDTPSPDMVVRRAKAEGDEDGLTRPAVTWKDINVAARFDTKKQYAAPDAAAMKKQKDRDDSIRKTITNDIEASDAPIERALELLKSYDTQIAENRDARETAKDDAALKQLNMRAASLGSRRRVVTKILEDQLDAVLPMPERDAISAVYAEEAAADGRYADENETTQEMLTTERMILEERLDMVAGTSYARVVEKELGKLAGREQAFDDTKALTYEADTGLKRGAEKVGSAADRARVQRRESPRTAELRTWAAKMLSEYATTATAERKEEIAKRINGWLRALRSDLKELRGKKEPTKEDLDAMLIADDQMSYGAMTAARIEAVRTGAIPAPTTAAELAAFGSIDPLGPVQRPAVKTDAVLEKKALSPAEAKLRALSMEELDRRIAEYGNVPKRKLRVGDRAEMTVLQAEKERRIPTPAQILASGVDEGRRLANAQVPVTTERFRTLSDKALEESIAEYDQEDFTDMYALLDERARRAESKARVVGTPKADPLNARGAGPYIVNPKRAAQKREVVIAPERRTVPRERREAADRAKARKAASDEEKTSGTIADFLDWKNEQVSMQDDANENNREDGYREDAERDTKRETRKYEVISSDADGEVRFYEDTQEYERVDLPTKPKWLFHGTRVGESALIDADGSLVLKPSKNFGGKTNGVSFTDDIKSAKDYATRIKGGGPKGFTFEGAKIIRIDSAALSNVEEEAMNEWADYSGKRIVIPKGSYTIEPVARDRFFLKDSHLAAGFKEYVRDNYRGLERDEVRENPEAAQEAYLESIIDDASSASDVTEAKNILRDEFGRGNKQGNTSTGTEATNSELQAEADRLLGKGPILLLNKLLKDLGGGGEFKRDANGRETISVAFNAMGRMGIMRHEALHAFFARLGGNAAKLKQDLTDVASHPRIMAELTKLLSKPGDEQALAQIQEGAPEYLEERLAYMYQFWAEGLLDITPKGRNIFQKIQDFFRNLAGVVAKHEKAERILTLFHSGEFADPTLVDAKIADNRIETASDKLERIAPAFTKSMEKVFTAGTDRLRNSGAPAVVALADKFEKFLQERAQAGSSWQNRLNGIMDGKTKAELTAAMENFQAMRDPKTDFEKAIAKFLSDMHEYQTAKNVRRSEWVPGSEGEPGYVSWLPMRKIEKNYFPRSFDGATIEKNRAEWDKLLTEFVPDAADRRAITENFIKGDGREEVAENEHQLGFTPWSKAVASRKLRFITKDNAHRFAKFENKDFVDTLSTYVQQAVHRAEYAEMFGNGGEVIQEAFNASNLGIDKLKELTDVTRGLEGTLGHDMNKSTKELFTGMMLMQNAVLLPLAIFSQMVDPLMIAARSGKLADAGKAYVQAFKSLVLKKGDDQKLAEWLGTVSDETVMQAMGNTHGSMHMSRRMRNFSRQFFKWNGMQGWNSAMRTAATVAGEKYLIDNKDNAEALKELGLKVGDVKIDASGKRLDIGKPDSALGKALFQFVDESVIRPNAAHRPTWMSDPRFMLLAHLKQFTFSMHKVVLERVADQAEKGNYHPMKMLALATPVMLAADMAKWSLTGKTPESWTYLDYLSHAVMRSGVLGKWQFGADALGDSERGKVPGTSFLGPTAEHLMLLMRYLTGGVGAEDVIDRTIPGARYVRNSFVGRVSDPMGAGNAERQLRKDGVGKTYDSTGWFKGPDGKMRKEIDPKKVTAALWDTVDWRSDPDMVTFDLTDVTDKVPEFAKYRDMFKGVKVHIGDPLRTRDGGGGQFDLGRKVVHIYAHLDNEHDLLRQVVWSAIHKASYTKQRELLADSNALPKEKRLPYLWRELHLSDIDSEVKSFIEDTFLHELQHGIQDVEGFENGGGLRTGAAAAALGPKQIGRARRLYDRGRVAEAESILDEGEDRFWQETTKGGTVGTPREFMMKKYEAYMDITGEAEAADVEARKGMTSSLRRRIRPALMDSSREFLRSTVSKGMLGWP